MALSGVSLLLLSYSLSPSQSPLSHCSSSLALLFLLFLLIPPIKAEAESNSGRTDPGYADRPYSCILHNKGLYHQYRLIDEAQTLNSSYFQKPQMKGFSSCLSSGRLRNITQVQNCIIASIKEVHLSVHPSMKSPVNLKEVRKVASIS